MSVADKLTTVAENVEKVYDAGKQAEYDRFWDNYQTAGETNGFDYAFAGIVWTDELYKPIRDIDARKSSYSIYYGTHLTDTKVKIILGASGRDPFYNAYGLEIIREVELTKDVTFGNAPFRNTSKLKHITFSGEGKIISDVSFQWSPLTHDSLISIINALKDYSADTSGTTHTLTLGSENVTKLSEAELKIINDKGWQYT